METKHTLAQAQGHTQSHAHTYNTYRERDRQMETKPHTRASARTHTVTHTRTHIHHIQGERQINRKTDLSRGTERPLAEDIKAILKYPVSRAKLENGKPTFSAF